MKKNILVLFILIGLVVLGACSSTPEATPTKVLEPPPIATNTDLPPTAEPTATEPEPVMLPVSMLSAVLGEEANNIYKIDMATFQPLEYEESELPAAPGTVTAQWYTSEGRYVVAYSGLDLTDAGPLCPGNSILTDTGFGFVSNAPTEDGACEGFTTLTSDPEVGPIICHGTMFYHTAIPSDKQGMLFGTLEALTEDGALIGLTSSIQSSPDMLEINLEELCK